MLREPETQSWVQGGPTWSLSMLWRLLCLDSLQRYTDFIAFILFVSFLQIYKFPLPCGLKIPLMFTNVCFCLTYILHKCLLSRRCEAHCGITAPLWEAGRAGLRVPGPRECWVGGGGRCTIATNNSWLPKVGAQFSCLLPPQFPLLPVQFHLRKSLCWSVTSVLQFLITYICRYMNIL